MPKLIMLVGPSGSGKTTLAKQYEAKGFTRISQDDTGKAHLGQFSGAIELEKDIVVDRLNFSLEQRGRYLEQAKDNSYETEIVVLHESKAECLRRCLVRTNHPTIKTEEDAQKALTMFYNKYERVIDVEADVVTRVWPAGIKDKAIWVDLDNTLSNADHREYHLKSDKKNWTGFFEAMGDDPVNEWCRDLINGMSKYLHVLICSARPNTYKKQTQEWLNKHQIRYNELIMRDRADFRKDSITKEIMLEFEVKTRFNLSFVVDDRRQVIEQLRSHGITVLDCAGEKGNF